MTELSSNRILLLGFDSADWKMIRPLLDDDKMPNLKALMGQGVHGNLRTLTPAISPMLWNSIATGKHGDQHGILGFVEPRPDGQGIQPASSHSRKCKAIWQIISESNKRADVVNWFASHPAENIPRFRELDLEKDHRPKQLIHRLAQLYTIHAAGTWLAEKDDWDFLAVYYESIDHFSHDFMEFHPPRMDHVNEADFDIYQNVMTEIYAYHDQILGRYLDIVDDETTVIVVSDHGFHSDHLRPAGSSSMQANPVSWHRENGILVAKGPKIKEDENIYGMSLLDIAPTILALLDLDVPTDMDGNAQRQWWKKIPEINYIESYESVSVDSEKDGSTIVDPQAATASMKQLAALGYLPDLSTKNEDLIKQAQHSQLATLALIFDESRC